MINQPVNLSDIFVDNQIDYLPISKKYFSVLVLQTIIAFLFFSIVPGVLFYTDAIKLNIAVCIEAGILILLLLLLGLIKLSYKYRGYAVRSHDVMYRKGILNIEETIIPYNRVQHVKVKKGLISKFFGLSELTIYTAAGNNFNLTIAGIEDGVAEQIKSYILEQLNRKVTDVDSRTVLNLKEQHVTTGGINEEQKQAVESTNEV